MRPLPPLLAFLLVLALQPSVFAQVQRVSDKMWTDSFGTYEDAEPLEGYFVPAKDFEIGKGPEQLIPRSQKMSPEQLHAFYRRAAGAAPPATPAGTWPLFVFKNHGSNVFCWEGLNDPPKVPKQVAVWNGRDWSWQRTPGLQFVEAVYYQPPDRERCYVLVRDSSFKRTVSTERIFFGPFPSMLKIFDNLTAAADTVVYLDQEPGAGQPELLDCLKGNITRSEFERLTLPLGARKYHTFFFLRGAGAESTIEAFYGEGFRKGMQGLNIDLVFDADAGAPENRPIFEPLWKSMPNRWKLAQRDAGEAPEATEGCQLRLARAPAAPGDWAVLEFFTHGGLYRMPRTRSQRDGGDPLFTIEVRRGETKGKLAPKGRFGEESQKLGMPEEDAELGLEYQFLTCTEGVLKVAVRPKQGGWEGVFQAQYHPDVWLRAPYTVTPGKPAADPPQVFTSREVPVNFK